MSKLPKVTIPTCHVNLIVTDSAYPYESDMLYGFSQISQNLINCRIDSQIIAKFNVEKQHILDEQMLLLSECHKLIKSNPVIYGTKIIEWVDFLKFLRSPEINLKEFRKYMKKINPLIAQLQTTRKTTPTLAAKLMNNIIEENLLTNGHTGLLHLLRYIGNKSHAQAIDKNLEDALELKKYYLNLLHDTYVNQSPEFAKKTINPKAEMLTIKGGSLLYKGVQMAKKQRLTAFEDQFWVAFDLLVSLPYISPENQDLENLKELCEQLGVIGVYQLKHDLTLCNLSQIVTIKTLRQKPNKPASFDQAFIITTTNGIEKLERNSQEGTDQEIAKWLCQLGYDGYVSDAIGHFHPEMMLCHPKEHLTYLGQYNANEIGLHYCHPDYYENPSAILFM